MWVLEGAYDNWRLTLARETRAFAKWASGINWGSVFVGDIKESMRMRAEIADWFDRENRRNAEAIRKLKTDIAVQLVRRVRSGGMADTVDSFLLLPTLTGVVAGEKLYDFVTTVASGYVDVLRLGQGVLVDKNVKGWGKDALRLISIIPWGAVSSGLRTAVVGARVRLLAQIEPQVAAYGSPTRYICTTNSAARAVALTRGRLFIKAMDLWIEEKTPIPKGHPYENGAWISEIEQPLKKVGAKVSAKTVSTMAEVIAAAERNPNGAVIFSIGNGLPEGSHTMMASAIEGRAVIYETNGSLFRSWQELFTVYHGYSMLKVAGQPNMAVIQGGRVLEGLSLLSKDDGLLNFLVVEVRYAPMLEEIIAKAASLYTDRVAWKTPPKPPAATSESSTPSLPPGELGVVPMGEPGPRIEDGGYLVE